MSLEPNQSILNGKYRIVRLVGEGAFARVWLAEETEFGGRQVAIKEPRGDRMTESEADDQARRFRQEVDLAALLERYAVPGVIRALTVERLADGTRLLVLAYADGGSLADLLRAHPGGLPVGQAVSLARQIALALDGFHRLPVGPVHRDVKPSNILLTAAGEAMLSDFGLAQLPGASGRSSGAGVGHPGTPNYMAPEQARSPEPLTPMADVFALGCVLFEMLTGKVYKRVKPGTQARDLRPDLPAWLDDVLARALAEDPWSRYASAGAMAAAMEAEVKAEAEAEAQRAERQRIEADKRIAAEQARVQQEKAEAEVKAKAAAEEQARRAAALRAKAQQEAEARASREAAAARPPRSEIAASPAARKWPVGWILLTLGLVAVIIWVVTQRGPTPAAPEPTVLPVLTQAPEPTKAPAFTQAPTAAPSTKVPEPTASLAPTEAPTLAKPTSAVSPTPAGATLSLALAPAVPLELVRVPAGEFLMGSDKAADPLAEDDELPQHRVSLPEYWIGKYEVTNRQYEAFVTATGRGAPAHWSGGRLPAGKEDHPVVNVSWDDAVAFSEWASTVTGRTIKLPSEAEWEKAARGEAGGIYPWGTAVPDAERCNFNQQVGDTTPVGQYPTGVSPYGALDMAGNVWEWTNSLDKPYPYQGGDGREDPNDRGARVLRGGSFNNVSQYVRCAFRGRYLPELRDVSLGFRVVSPGL